MGFLRYMLALIVGFAAYATAFAALAALGWTVLLTGPVAVLVGLMACLLVNEAGVRHGRAFDRRRLRPTLVIASVLQLALLTFTLSRFPTLQPLAAATMSGLAGILFAVAGYWRFFHRVG